MSAPPPDLPPHYTIARYLYEQLTGYGAACWLLHQGRHGTVVILGGPPEEEPPALVLIPDPPRHVRLYDRGGRRIEIDLSAEEAVVEILNRYRAP